VGGPLLGGMVVGFSITNDILGWYKTLRKPSWTPPNWLFGPVRALCRAAASAAQPWLRTHLTEAPPCPSTRFWGK
jgi:tryptophan-rich sensory protein